MADLKGKNLKDAPQHILFVIPEGWGSARDGQALACVPMIDISTLGLKSIAEGKHDAHLDTNPYLVSATQEFTPEGQADPVKFKNHSDFYSLSQVQKIKEAAAKGNRMVSTKNAKGKDVTVCAVDAYLMIKDNKVLVNTAKPIEPNKGNRYFSKNVLENQQARIDAVRARKHEIYKGTPVVEQEAPAVAAPEVTQATPATAAPAAPETAVPEIPDYDDIEMV